MGLTIIQRDKDRSDRLVESVVFGFFTLGRDGAIALLGCQQIQQIGNRGITGNGAIGFEHLPFASRIPLEQQIVETGLHSKALHLLFFKTKQSIGLRLCFLSLR